MPTKKDCKVLGIRIYNSEIIDLIDNLQHYYIKDYQLGFKSQSQLAEVCFNYLLQNKILIKREEKQ